MNTITDITPLRDFLENDISAQELSDLIDSLSFDYTQMLLRLQSIDSENTISANAEKYVLFLRGLRDALRDCHQ